MADFKDIKHMETIKYMETCSINLNYLENLELIQLITEIRIVKFFIISEILRMSKN